MVAESLLEADQSAVFLTKVLLLKKTGRGEIPDLPDLTEVERMITEQRP